jgi:hypothetical protein
MSLDREIDDLLAVDHSPEFLAKVRRRVAAEPRPGMRWLSWKMVPVTSLVGLALALLLWPIGNTTPEPVVQRGRPVTPIAPTIANTIAPASAGGGFSRPDAVAPTSRAIAPPVEIAPGAADLAHASVATAATAGKLTPQVVIAPSDADGFELLLARIEDGSLPMGSASLAGAETAGPPWIEISPVVIDPISWAEGE